MSELLDDRNQLPRKETKFLILLCIFVACMGFIQVVSAKLWTFAGLTISGGIMAYWLTFPITDVIGEVYGRKRAFFVVWMGLLASVIVVGFSQIAIYLPPSPAYTDQAALESVLGAIPLIVLASMLAYICAQLHDVWAFAFWRSITGERHLWLRNNLSTMSSQLVDSLIFNGVAFYLFAAERMPLSAFLSMTLGYWLFKVCIAIIDTPVVYLLVAWVKADETDDSD